MWSRPVRVGLPPSRRGRSRIRSRTTLHAARRNVRHHHDLGNDCYQLFLDRQMVYTCAYFPTPGASLEKAQTAKMDLVCRKLRLRAGERVIEAGCGWGALALHMARKYGVQVQAFNVSRVPHPAAAPPRRCSARPAAAPLPPLHPASRAGPLVPPRDGVRVGSPIVLPPRTWKPRVRSSFRLQAEATRPARRSGVSSTQAPSSAEAGEQ
jgi:hypothetical protein